MLEREDVLRLADGGHVELIGNHLALDLVNTVAWRLDPRRAVDRLPDGEALQRWATVVGLPGTVGAPTGEADRAATAVRELREQLHRALQPVALGGPPDAAALRELRTRLLAALAREEVEVARLMPLEWSVDVRTVADLPSRLALAAWDLLAHEDGRRLRQCRDDDCGWLFLDRSRNGSRVWCSSADCGNRARARRHYARHAGSHPRSTGDQP
jgi:predicted RNA-binding Zn ribbon-like protein